MTAVLEDKFLCQIMSGAYDTAVSTYILSFINWAYVRTFFQEIDETEYMYLGRFQ